MRWTAGLFLFVASLAMEAAWAQQLARDFTIPMQVSFSQSGDVAHWTLRVDGDMAKLTPVLLPGDTATIRFGKFRVGSSSAPIGLWTREYRCYSHTTTKYGFWRTNHYKKTTVSWPKNGGYNPHPLSADFSPSLSLVRENDPNALVRVVQIKKVGATPLGEIGSAYKLDLAGTTQLNVPQHFKHSCQNPTRGRGRKLVFALGSTPQTWFTLILSVTPPVLD